MQWGNWYIFESFSVKPFNDNTRQFVANVKVNMVEEAKRYQQRARTRLQNPLFLFKKGIYERWERREAESCQSFLQFHQKF